MTRYHPLLVVLHWLMAVLVILSLVSGGIAPLAFHVASGAAILFLLLMRVATRLRVGVPRPVDTRGLQARLAHWMHLGLYALLFGVLASGIGLAVQADLPQVMSGAKPHGASLAASPMYAAHAALTVLLKIAVAIHLLAALWHQFVRRDRLFARMWFGRRA